MARNRRHYTSGQNHLSNRYRNSQFSNRQEVTAPISETNSRQPVENNKWSTADKISFWGVMVNVILAGFTFMLYQLSVGATYSAKVSADAARVSADAAKTSADLQKKSLDKQIESQVKADSAESVKDKHDNAAFELQQRSVSAQIAALEDNKNYNKKRFRTDTTTLGLQIKGLRQGQEQFNKQYEPYLQVSIDSTNYSGNRLIIHYTIVNLTSTPVKVITNKLQLVISAAEPIFKSDNSIEENNLNYYVIKEAPAPRSVTTNDTIPAYAQKWINNRDLFVYWQNEIKYQNLISLSIRTYKFQVKISKLASGRAYPEFKYNTNQ